MYSLVRPLLFALDAETAHRLTLRSLSAIDAMGLLSQPAAAPASCARVVMGLSFPNPVGLAAGLDKNGEHIDALARLGFGFIEVGTVTPRPQPGNPRPRLFRIASREAIINRFGFNNVGLDAFLANVARTRWRGVLGINIGRNADTPPERSVEDYEIGLEKVYTAASYVTLNISSPNTKGLRSLQEKDSVEQLLARLADLRKKLIEKHGKRVPLVLKVAPDLDVHQVKDISQAILRHGIDGLIATNTSTTREGVEGLPHAEEAGGLSGAPIRDRSTRTLSLFRALLGDQATLIGAGGILSGGDAAEKFAAGAKLVQLYTGLVYRGPGLVGECVSAYRAK
jgi:dihydroorotate dehydrogenase